MARYMTKYYLQNRYQDGGWDRLPGEDYDDRGEAICRASVLSNDAIAYGMVRVVDSDCLECYSVVVTFGAGVGHDGRKSFV